MPLMLHRNLSDAAPTDDGEPFSTAAGAWFWTIGALNARNEGGRRSDNPRRVTRPCTPDDIVKALDRLYQARRIDLRHARILRIWGERGQQPDGRLPHQRSDARIWNEALDRLGVALRQRGIVRADVI